MKEKKYIEVQPSIEKACFDAANILQLTAFVSPIILHF